MDVGDDSAREDQMQIGDVVDPGEDIAASHGTNTDRFLLQHEEDHRQVVGGEIPYDI